MKTYTTKSMCEVSGLKSHNKITVSSKVCVFDFSVGKEECYAFDKRDDSFNFVSLESPVGKALLGREVGDLVEITVPFGKRTLKITKII